MKPIRPWVALVAVALVGACGSTSSGGAGATGRGSSTSPASAPTPSGTTTAATTPNDPENPTLPGSRGRLVTVTGTVSEGVEHGCLLLTPEPSSPGGPWQLIGNVAGIKAGQRVTVRGARIDSMATTCQQGLPFHVEGVVPG